MRAAGRSVDAAAGDGRARHARRNWAAGVRYRSGLYATLENTELFVDGRGIRSGWQRDDPVHSHRGVHEAGGTGAQCGAGAAETWREGDFGRRLRERTGTRWVNCGWTRARRRRMNKVYLVGAGPGDPELLTLKAKRLLEKADSVLYDHLAGPELSGACARGRGAAVRRQEEIRPRHIPGRDLQVAGGARAARAERGAAERRRPLHVRARRGRGGSAGGCGDTLRGCARGYLSSGHCGLYRGTPLTHRGSYVSRYVHYRTRRRENRLVEGGDGGNAGCFHGPFAIRRDREGGLSVAGVGRRRPRWRCGGVRGRARTRLQDAGNAARADPPGMG